MTFTMFIYLLTGKHGEQISGYTGGGGGGGMGQNLKTKLCLNRTEIYIFLSKDSNSRLSAQKTKNIVLCQN